MCGIAGFWLNKKSNSSIPKIESMLRSIEHRGPDGEGIWSNNEKNVFLGHRRLSIIDLSDRGSQPMETFNRYTITYNGEIYNFIELREKLKFFGYVFKSDTDTEVILHAYDKWGLNCFDYFDGMFSFAIYDRYKKELICGRDRFGEKPFYYTFYEDTFYFASEMKALWAAGIPKNMNPKMLYNYLANNLVENPNDQKETFYNNIFKLKSSHYFVFKGERHINQKKYWSINFDTIDVDFKQASSRINELLSISIQRRLRSDVPIGTSLSGGLDSSSIVGLASEKVRGLNTFSARFPGFYKDEGEFIDIVKNKFHTNHENIFIDKNDLFQDLMRLLWHQEEPFQSGSIYAQYMVYKKAREKGTIVMLDGQGADELFCGYFKDFDAYLRYSILLKKEISSLNALLKKNHNYSLSIDFNKKLGLYFPGFYSLIKKIKSQFIENKPIGLNNEFHKEYKSSQELFFQFNDLKSTLNYQLTNQGLEKLLKYADRNSMSNSIEVRLPFLCHSLVEYVFSLPSDFFLQNGWSKSLLRNTVNTLLPEKIVYRKDKIGFEAPDNEWISTKDFMDIINEGKIKMISEGIINSNFNSDWKILMSYMYFFSNNELFEFNKN